jgi:hypothetical protein
LDDLRVASRRSCAIVGGQPIEARLSATNLKQMAPMPGGTFHPETVLLHRPVADFGIDNAQFPIRVLDDQAELETRRYGVDVQHG